jgi:hypothetical protein
MTMGEPKFTPGPWMFADGSRRLIITKVRSIANAIGCILGGEDVEADANARLILAAPELYAEAEKARAMLESVGDLVRLGIRLDRHLGEAMRERAAELAKMLAKARGEA